ncbi:DnaJ sub A member 3, mitochondrial [Saitoella coloradoensis]
MRPQAVRTIRSAPAISGLSRRRFHQSFPTHNHYETLNVRRDSTPREIKRRFYELSKKYHPDRNPDDATAKPKFLEVTEAYSVLRSDQKRRDYDRSLLGRSSDAPTGHGHPTGHRQPSGLSRRRTRPQGPPPSYTGHNPYSSNNSHPHTQSSYYNSTHPGHNFTGYNTHNPHWSPAVQAAYAARYKAEDARRYARQKERDLAQSRRDEQSLRRPMVFVLGFTGMMIFGGILGVTAQDR